MSIKCMTRVWESSKAKGSVLLLMLAIADYAHDDGTNAYPSIETLARKMRMSERNVQLLVKEAQKLGELTVEAGGGRNNTNLYTIALPQKGENFTGVKSSVRKGEIRRAETVKSTSPDPLLGPLVHTRYSKMNEKPYTVSLPDDEHEDGTVQCPGCKERFSLGDITNGKTPCCGATIDNLKAERKMTVDDKGSQIARYLRAQAIGFERFESVRQRDSALSLEKDFEWSLIAKAIDYGLGVKKVPAGGIVNYALGIRKHHAPNKVEQKSYPTQEDYERNLLERAQAAS